MKVYIVIPAYNEAARIGDVLKDIKKVTSNVIVVDDGSADNTSQVAKKYIKNVLKHRVNLGKGATLKTACEAAFGMGADAVIMMDSDGQHKVEDIPVFIEALENGFDVVFGSRNFYMGIPLVRFLGNKFASLLVSLMFGIYVSDILCGFKAITKSAYKKMNWESKGYGIETEMAVLTAKKRLSHCEVAVQAVYLDRLKGVTLLDAFDIFFSVLRWRLTK